MKKSELLLKMGVKMLILFLGRDGYGIRNEVIRKIRIVVGGISVANLVWFCSVIL